MTAWVALLRGINVGGHRRVPMAELRELAGELGLHDVRSYVQSGNLVFRAAGDQAEYGAALERAIERRFGFAVDVVVRDRERWQRYCAGAPFAGARSTEPNRVFLVLAQAPPNPDCAEVLAPHATAGERIRVVGDAVWVHAPAGAGRSRLGGAVYDRAIGAPATARNWNTVAAVQTLLADGGG